jgi:hypothetical protein
MEMAIAKWSPSHRQVYRHLLRSVHGLIVMVGVCPDHQGNLLKSRRCGRRHGNEQNE